MGGEQAACLWTDPPYGVSYVGGTKDKLTLKNDDAEGLDGLLAGAFAAIDPVLADGAAIYIAHPAGALSVTFGQPLPRPGLAPAPDAGLGERFACPRPLRLPLPPRADPVRLQARTRPQRAR